jgi:hypothetical protein
MASLMSSVLWPNFPDLRPEVGALSSRRAKLRVFSYDADFDGWFTDQFDILQIKELIGARMTI